MLEFVGDMIKIAVFKVIADNPETINKLVKILIAIDIKAAERFGQLKYVNNNQEKDCKKPIRTPIKGAKRAILLNLGLINGN